MPSGYNGRILRVDLSTRTVRVDEPDELFYRGYFGGTNLVAYYLLKETRPGVDPLGPENRLVFATGPLTGFAFAGSGRHSVGAKSPLTGGFGSAESGGYFGAELKHAGFDAVVVEGASRDPVYLLIEDGRAEVRDALHLWGRTVGETQDQLRRETGEPRLRVAALGPSGERLVRYACVVNDLADAAGRTGMGAVMGSKGLKAIAVRGRGGPPAADPEKLRELSRWMAQNWRRFHQGQHDVGTTANVLPLNVSGALPTRNFREGSFEGAKEISGEVMRETLVSGRRSCYACAVQCKKDLRPGGPWGLDDLHGAPEYESVAALGSCCGVSDLGAVAKASQRCNALGLDTISTGMAIAFAMECFEAGLLTKADCDGLELRFGNGAAMVRMVEKIANREGLGDLLAEGVKRAADRIGGEARRYAMHVKGQELPLHEPRTKPAVGVGYAVSPTGADHQHNMHDPMFAKPGPFFDRMKSMGILQPVPVQDLGDEKVRLLYYESTYRHAANTLVICIFLRWSPAQVTELLGAVTGWNSTFMEVFNSGRRAVTLARLFNLREGFTAADDRLPGRLYEKFGSGPSAGMGPREEEVRRAISTYYEMAGWTEEGVPTRGHLAELNLGWAGAAVQGVLA